MTLPAVDTDVPIGSFVGAIDDRCSVGPVLR
jgi:hypothetical protein